MTEGLKANTAVNEQRQYTGYPVGLQYVLPRVLYIPRTMLSQDVRMSVRLSVRHTPVFYRKSKRVNISSNFFFTSGSHTILNQTVWQYSDGDGNPLTGASNAAISRFISEMIQDRAIVTMKWHANRKLY